MHEKVYEPKGKNESARDVKSAPLRIVSR